MPETETLNPTNLKLALRAKAGRNIVALAGGTDLLVWLHDTIDRAWPTLLLLEGIKSFHEIKVSSDEVILGPLATFSEIARSRILLKYAPQLVEAASVAGSVQIRNRATIGGNVANASPAGDLIPPLYALGARLQLSSVNGSRYVSIEDFSEGPGATVLKWNELVTRISFRKTLNRGFFLRLATRRALAISKVSVAASVFLHKGNVSDVKIALGSVAPTVIRARSSEEYLIGKKLTDEVILRAAEIAKGESCPIDDIRSNAVYRREMVGVLLKRGLTQISCSR